MKKFEKVEKTGIIATKFSLRCTPSVILGLPEILTVKHFHNYNWIFFAKWLPNAKSERVSTFNPKCRMPYNFVTAPFVREPIWQKNERRKKRSYVLLINNAQNVK